MVVDSCIVCVFVYLEDAERLLDAYDEADTDPSLDNVVPAGFSRRGVGPPHGGSFFSYAP